MENVAPVELAKNPAKTFFDKKWDHLHEWAIQNEPSDTMIYKKGYWRQIMFIRDEITDLFYKKDGPTYQVLEVVSTHTSKSIKLPVYHLILQDGTEIIMRDNFHGWQISVESPKMLEFPLNVFESIKPEKIHSCYCEGFKEEWVFDSYLVSKRKFTASIYNQNNMYVFLFLLNEQTGGARSVEV